MARQGDDLRRIIEPKKGDALYHLAIFLEAFDIRTAYPLLLTFLDVDIDASAWATISTVIESYLVRRTVCAMTTKNYNRIRGLLSRSMERIHLPSDRWLWPHIAYLQRHRQRFAGAS